MNLDKMKIDVVCCDIMYFFFIWGRDVSSPAPFAIYFDILAFKNSVIAPETVHFTCYYSLNYL